MDIQHKKDKIEFSMASAEMDKEDLKDNIVLSENNRIKGKLHIEGIKSVRENNKPYSDIFKMRYEDAEIFHFEVHQNKVEFQIKWNSYPATPKIKDFSIIEIEAKKIWWENIPGLENQG